MPLVAEVDQFGPPYDLEDMNDLGEAAVAKAIANMTLSQIRSPSASLVSKLLPKLLLQVPELLLENTAEDAEFVADGEAAFRVELEVRIVDPNNLAPLIHQPDLPEWIEFEVDHECGFVRAIGLTSDLTIEEAFAELAHVLSRYQSNIELAAQQVERFNAALPYLISAFVQTRLDEPWKHDGATHEPQARLVSDGKVVSMFEYDPETGKPRPRHV